MIFYFFAGLCAANISGDPSVCLDSPRFNGVTQSICPHEQRMSKITFSPTSISKIFWDSAPDLHWGGAQLLSRVQTPLLRLQ